VAFVTFSKASGKHPITVPHDKVIAIQKVIDTGEGSERQKTFAASVQRIYFAHETTVPPRVIQDTWWKDKDEA